MAATPELQIKKSALAFNKLIKAPRTGKSAADPDLWAFSASIQPSPAVVDYLKSQFELFQPQLESIFESELNQISDLQDYPFEFKLVAHQGGSVDNKTYLTSPDLDIYLVLNSTKRLKTMSRVNNNLQYGNGEILLTSAMVCATALACGAAMKQFLLEQQAFSALELTQYVSNGMTVFTLKEITDSFEGFQLEFDVVPVLQLIGGNFLLLGTDGTLVPSSISSVSHTIEVQSKRYLGLREMMVVLKLVHKSGIKQGLSSLKLVPSCALESAVLQLVIQRREKAAAWWKDSTFTEIFRAAIDEMINAIKCNAKLPALNNPNEDILRNIRACSDEFVVYYTGWKEVEESALRARLKSSLKQLTTPADQSDCQNSSSRGHQQTDGQSPPQSNLIAPNTSTPSAPTSTPISCPGSSQDTPSTSSSSSSSSNTAKKVLILVCTKWTETLPGNIVQPVHTFADIYPVGLQSKLEQLRNPALDIKFLADLTWEQCEQETKQYQPDVLQLLTHGISGQGIRWMDRVVTKDQFLAFLEDVAITWRAPLDTIILTVCHSTELVPEIRASHWIVTEGASNIALNQFYSVAFHTLISTHTVEEAHNSGLLAIKKANITAAQVSIFRYFPRKTSARPTSCKFAGCTTKYKSSTKWFICPQCPYAHCTKHKTKTHDCQES